MVEGYCDARSYVAGDGVRVRCSTTSATFSAEIARIGATRDVVWRRDGIAGAEHDVPADASTNGCGWPATFVVPVERAWPSGFYELTFRAAGRPDGHACFAVRNADRRSANAILLVLSTNTYWAYNRWGGSCFYTGASQVSFARPLDPGYIVKPVDADGYDGRFATIDPVGDPEHRRLAAYLAEHGLQMWTSSAGWWNWERRFVRWAESHGHRLDVAVNSDLEQHPEVLVGHSLMVSVGHDEYWSAGMRDAVDHFVDGSGNVAFFGGNTSVWRVHFADDGQTMVRTGAWSDPVTGRPESTTTGLSFWRGGYARIGHALPASTGAYTVHRPDHWAFAGLDMHAGDQLGERSRPVGYELDGCAFDVRDGVPTPTHEDVTPDGFTILATSPAKMISITEDTCEAPVAFWASVEPPGDLQLAATLLFGDASDEHVARLGSNHAVMGTFTRNGAVFNVGSADWAYGLDDDAEVQAVTANVLDRMSGS